MFIGKWNKSVILTYIGLVTSIVGMFLCYRFENSINWAISCLIIAGICDLFDGAIARKCKRTEEEKNFGIQLDSLVDTISFIALPVTILFKMQMNSWYQLIIIAIFAICGIARLAYFNISVEDNNTPVKYYCGLPVTFTALILPVFYLLKYAVPVDIFNVLYTVLVLVVAILNILNIKILKPKGIAYGVFSILAIIMLILYLGVL